MDRIREEVIESLTYRCENYMANDWLPEEAEGHMSLPVEGFYMEPEWTRTEKAGLQEKQVSMDKLYDIFNIYKDNGRVLAEGRCFGLFFSFNDKFI